MMPSKIREKSNCGPSQFRVFKAALVLAFLFPSVAYSQNATRTIPPTEDVPEARASEVEQGKIDGQPSASPT